MTRTTAQAPGALPLLGHALPLLRDPLSFLNRLPALDDVVQIQVGPQRAYVVCTADLTREVLVDDRTFDKGGLLFDRARESVGDGLGTCPHSRHRRQRRLVQPAFHVSRMPGYAEMMTARITAFADGLHSGQVIDVVPELTALTTRITAEAIFTDALPAEAMGHLVEDLFTIFEGIYRRSVVPAVLNRVPTPANRRYDRARTRLRRTLDQAIQHRRTVPSPQADILSMLLDVRGTTADGTADRLTDEEISDQIITIFAAGADTTAGLLAWALHLIAQHPKTAYELHTEVDTVLAGRPAAYEHLPALEHTRRILTETLRLRPSGWLLTRTTSRDASLAGHVIPRGSTVIVSPYLVHHLPEHHPEPDSFDPNRWAPTGTGSLSPRNASLPFSAGARKCIGDTFALTEATLALATLTAAWRFEPVPGTTVRPACGLTLSLKGLRMRVQPRSPA
ncbi:cytochrome P450 [Streptomyces sp. NPDC050400]|uniref:cytochrome P450 n=1 Tax=Streptomyces sp. NPDC050400 TaxID=3365610 RepID=UPI0037B94ACA